MYDYYNATICENGHVIDCRQAISNEYCPKCGSVLITKCPHCNANIRGRTKEQEIIDYSIYVLPNYCHNCGKAYPWTSSALETAKEIILEDEQLQQLEKENAVNSLKDIIVETPKTNLAVIRMKKLLTAAGKFTADSIRQFIIDFGCEIVKQQFMS